MFNDLYFDSTKKRKIFSGVLIQKQQNVLLGMKNRGFGKGKWQHSFAGKVELSESLVDAAQRELFEESGLIVEKDNLVKIGYFEYEFTDARIVPWIMEVHIFGATEWKGEIRASEEISPEWCNKSAIPYRQMWKDNEYWLDSILQGHKVRAYFLYSNYDVIEKKTILFDQNL